MPAQSSRSIGFLMLVGSSLTLCGIICNNKAMLSPGFLRYDPSKSNYGLLVTIVASVLFAFLHTNTLKSRQSLSCLCGTAAAPLGMPEATPTTHQALRGRIQTYFYGPPKTAFRRLRQFPLNLRKSCNSRTRGVWSFSWRIMPLSAQKQRERRAAQRAAEAQDAARGQRNRPAPSRC